MRGAPFLCYVALFVGMVIGIRHDDEEHERFLRWLDRDDQR